MRTPSGSGGRRYDHAPAGRRTRRASPAAADVVTNRGRRPSRPRLLGAVVACSLLVGAALTGGTGSAAPGSGFTRVDRLGVGPSPTYAMVRTANGVLHLLFQTTPGVTSSPNGLAARTISPSGTLGPQATALNGWGAGRPGMTDSASGALQGVFGAVSPPPKQLSGMWSISSANGGGSWAAPAEVGSGSDQEGQTYGANYRMERSGSTPVVLFTVAGNVTVQQGLGQGSPFKQVTTAADNFAGDLNSTVDGGSHEVVASWQSLAGKGGTFVRGVAPKLEPVQKVPGRPSTQFVIAGRDSGQGVFGAYTTDGTHVSLLRYGGGSVPVGTMPGVTAKVLGVATGIDGRIWVMWGDENGGLAVSRSNKAVTRFEPLQHLDPHAVTLHRLAGEGSLGPLDLLVDMIPVAGKSFGPPGTFYARVLPELSATAKLSAVKNKAGTVIAQKLEVVVTDAGDKVAGAKVSAAGKSGKTAAAGEVALTLPASAGSPAVTVTAPGYQPLTVKTTG